MDKGVMEEAANGGHLELVQWLRGVGCEWAANVCQNAAEGGNLEVLQWLRANGCPWDFCTCTYAVYSGHVEVLRWARENGCEWSAWARNRAAEKLGYTDDLGNLLVR